MQEQTEETHEEYPWTYDLMYNFLNKGMHLPFDFLLDPYP